MENSDDLDKKVNKAKSHCYTPLKLRNESGKRKSFNVNEAVRSLDLALGKLKKSRMVNGECDSTASTAFKNFNRPMQRESKDMFMDVCPSSNFSQTLGNTSLMSMNFSHYELVRNLSSSNCNSDGAISCTTCSAQRPQPADSSIKDEQLERFFRSAEMWTRKYKEGPSKLSNILDK